ncbi:MAG: molybdate ABC transporter ATP-binding protein ModF [Akkermansiaceae bacterium]
MKDTAETSCVMSLNNIRRRNHASRPDGGCVSVESFRIMHDEHWAVLGGNGSGKSTFASMLANDSDRFPLSEKQRITGLKNIQRVSFEDEQDLLEREIYEDDSEILDRIDPGRTTHELITELSTTADTESIVELMQLRPFLHTGFRLLSTGERRRLMIARALSQSPQMLILDEPYDGLDRAFTAELKTIIANLSKHIIVVLIVNRLSHLGKHITHLACLNQMELVAAGPRQEVEASPLWAQLQSFSKPPTTLPSSPSSTESTHTAKETSRRTEAECLLELHKIKVEYHQKKIIHDLTWQIMPSEHWKISGPNGCGKSTLVNLISGDHPQCYSNEIFIFGQKRSEGESIWDIKRNMGLMSTALHQQHRVSVTAETVVLSGFYDSIGLYHTPTPEQQKIAAEWLQFMRMETLADSLFQQLSFGQQRMLLIARALVKQPRLLILDEPCQGLDPINRALVIQLIDHIARLNIAQILYISHDPEDHLDCLTHELEFVNPPGGFSQRRL